MKSMTNYSLVIGLGLTEVPPPPLSNEKKNRMRYIRTNNSSTYLNSSDTRIAQMCPPILWLMSSRIGNWLKLDIPTPENEDVLAIISRPPYSNESSTSCTLTMKQKESMTNYSLVIGLGLTEVGRPTPLFYCQLKK